MVSASHNPADDNGLKVLDGRASSSTTRSRTSSRRSCWRADELVGPTNERLGRMVDAHALLGRYVEHRMALARSFTRSDGRDRARLRQRLRLRRRAARSSPPPGAASSVRFDDPDGVNINLDCGATAPGALARAGRRAGADVGFALDGDADRCVAVDEHGQVVDGDQLLGIIALDRLARGQLPEGIVVASVLSNGGLETRARAPPADGWRGPRSATSTSSTGCSCRAPALGGEKSGHVIIARAHHARRRHRDRARDPGDHRPHRPAAVRAGGADPALSAAAADDPVRHKDQWEADPTFARAVDDAEAELDGGGRVLVRPSGTEPALRIMVEGEDAAACRPWPISSRRSQASA